MKVSLWISTFLVCHHATEISLITDGKVAYEKLNSLKDLCRSIRNISYSEREDAIENLEILRNWEHLIRIRECRSFIKRNFNTIFEDDTKILGILGMGESVWESFVKLGIARELCIKVRNGIQTLKLDHINEDLIQFMLHLYNFHIS